MRYMLVCHGSNRSGTIERIEQFLINQNETVYKLIHPLDGNSRKYSSFSSEGLSKIWLRTNSGPISLIEDFFQSVRITQKQEIDVYVGATNFDTLPALFCKYILRKKIPKIIYYPRDFYEEKYISKVMNKIYYTVEKIVVRRSDLTVSNTHRAANKRMSYGLKIDRSKVVPNGVALTKPKFPVKKIESNKFVYIGDVTKEHGLYDVLPSLRSVAKLLIIIGTGDDWDRTIAQCKKIGINTELHYGKSHEFVLKYLETFNGFGLAPYNTFAKWTIYCSPLKVAEYVSSGVPVIVSDVPEIADLIVDKNLGIMFKVTEPNEIKNKIKVFDKSLYNKKAKWFYDNFNSDYLYREVFYGK